MDSYVSSQWWTVICIISSYNSVIKAATNPTPTFQPGAGRAWPKLYWARTDRETQTQRQRERERERERESVFFIAQELVVIVVYLHALEESGRREKNNKHQSVTIIISYLCGIRE